MYNNPYTEGYFERGEGSNYYNYGNDVGWLRTVHVLRELMRANQDPPGDDTKPKILELGSAKGYFLHAAELWGFDAYGLDVSVWAVQQTLPNMKNKNILHDVAKDIIPFDNENFDVVCSWEFLEHVYGEDIDFVLSESLRVLKHGGLYVHRIAITDGQMAPDNDATHVSMFPRMFWEKEFRQRGLLREPEYENEFSASFGGRDWSERFFIWRKP